ncbi:hypothetical protein [Sphaerospermopsis sp. FACHB-1094]|uniref:hypothetical protein n=1 Tax=Sphaerospermopsis sp. FACHB-1094 TaxID=2692861 RepID=UPI001687FAE9|nr:hypothetical protein [Sphaerospermopsis sp. FACHB-1094]
MNFTNIEIVGEFPFATRQPSKSELQEILAALNNSNFSIRRELTADNNLYKAPHDLKWDDACHATARKFSVVNKNLVVISGYLIKFAGDKAKLISHSVVKDTETNIIWELMTPLYPIDEYQFIEHSPEIQDHDLVAW